MFTERCFLADRLPLVYDLNPRAGGFSVDDSKKSLVVFLDQLERLVNYWFMDNF